MHPCSTGLRCNELPGSFAVSNAVVVTDAAVNSMAAGAIDRLDSVQRQGRGRRMPASTRFCSAMVAGIADALDGAFPSLRQDRERACRDRAEAEGVNWGSHNDLRSWGQCRQVADEVVGEPAAAALEDRQPLRPVGDIATLRPMAMGEPVPRGLWSTARNQRWPIHRRPASRASGMVWTRAEVVGDADEVIRVLGHLGIATVRVPDGEQVPAMGQERSESSPVSEPSAAEISPAPLSGGWTEELAADFAASRDAVARRVALDAWRAGTAGIHPTVALCQHAELWKLIYNLNRRGQRDIRSGKAAQQAP